jgi:hypothetical protein
VNVTTVRDGGGTAPGAGEWDLLTPAPGPPPAFRRELAVRFPAATGGARLRVVEAGTAARGAFLPLDYDALHPPGSVPAATASAAGDAVAIELPGPSRVLRIGLRGPANAIERMRTKGQAVGDVRVEEGMIALVDLGVALHRMDGPHPVADPTVTGTAGVDLGDEFTDARFAIAATSGGEPFPITPADVTEVVVRSVPLGARISAGPAPDRKPDSPPSSPTAVFVAAGDIGGKTPEAAGRFDVGSALAGALQAALDDPERTSPEAVDVPLTLESGAPCRVSVSAFTVELLWAISSFDDGGSDKQVLRFRGTCPGPQTLALALDGSAVVTEASVRTLGSFRPDRATPVAGGPSTANSPEASGDRGLPIGGGRTAAARLVQASAVTATGIALGALPLEPGTELLIEVREDQKNSPTGRALWSGAVSLGPPGEAGWFSATFDQSIVLSSDPYWVVASAKAGRAVWLATPSDEGSPVDGGALAGDGDAAPSAPVPGVAPLVRALSRSTMADAGPATALTVGGTVVARTPPPTPPPPVPPGPPGDRYDLSAGVAAYVAAHPSSATIRVPLTFTSVAPGNLTVYPPEVLYDLPG